MEIEWPGEPARPFPCAAPKSASAPSLLLPESLAKPKWPPQRPEGLDEARVVLRLMEYVRDDDLLAVEAV